jgi:transcriptional regulator
MHPDRTFHWTDHDAMREFVAQESFGTLFVQTPDGPAVAHVPVVVMADDRIGFHLSRGNRLAEHVDGARALFTILGAHAYISPDWYGMEDQVPTWNYVAVELEGVVAPMDGEALPGLIDALSAAQEKRLAPKPAWTRDKMRDGLFDRMLGAISGHVLTVDIWRGTRKLGQNKPAVARAGVADALYGLNEPAIAALMRETIG